jgi:hypothetical protein
MDIYNLPIEIQNKIYSYVGEHPTAKIMKEEINNTLLSKYFG